MMKLRVGVRGTGQGEFRTMLYNTKFTEVLFFSISPVITPGEGHGLTRGYRIEPVNTGAASPSKASQMGYFPHGTDGKDTGQELKPVPAVSCLLLHDKACRAHSPVSKSQSNAKECHDNIPDTTVFIE